MALPLPQVPPHLNPLQQGITKEKVIPTVIRSATNDPPSTLRTMDDILSCIIEFEPEI